MPGVVGRWRRSSGSSRRVKLAPRLASVTARRNGLSASQLFTWRRLARAGRLVEGEEATTFAPAIISPETLSTGLNPCSEPLAAPERSPSSTVAIASAGRIEIVLRCGRRVIVDNGIDAETLARVLACWSGHDYAPNGVRCGWPLVIPT